jgi:predicted alpha/beta-hydrolase family hydrolase
MNTDGKMPKRKRPAQDTHTKEKNDPSKEENPTPISAPPPASSRSLTSESFSIPPSPNNKKEISCLLHAPSSSPSPYQPPLIFTHGVGGTITSSAMQDFASGFGPVAPLLYFQGNMNLTSRIKAFSAVRAHQESAGGFAGFGGRSMGSRAAVMAALEDDGGCRRPGGDGGGGERVGMKLVLVSYPLTAAAAGKKGGTREVERREKILLDLAKGCEVLFVVGTRDAQCDWELLEDVRGRMEAESWAVVVVGADHGMECRPKKATEEMRRVSGRLAAEWMESRDRERRYCEVKVDEGGNVVCGGWMAERSAGVVEAIDDE